MTTAFESEASYQDMTLVEIADSLRVDMAQASEIQKGKRPDRVKATWGSEILSLSLPEPDWVVPKFIPEGLTTLAGRPKVGKSWLILQVLKAISSGGELFGESIEPRECLYLAIEDSVRRLQQRLKKQDWPKDFNHVALRPGPLPKLLDKGGVDWLKSEIESNSYQLVIIDTISRAVSSKIDQNRSGDTVSIFSKLQSLAWGLDCPIILIDHFKKPAKDANDVVDEVSGSTGKTGVADTIIGIFKKRNFPSAQLKIDGRDIDAKDLTIEWQKDTCDWKFLGDTQNVIDNRSDSKVMNIILELEDLGEEATHTNIHAKTGWNSKGTTSKRLNALLEKGNILKDENNIYSLDPSALFDTDDEFLGNNGNQETSGNNGN